MKMLIIGIVCGALLSYFLYSSTGLKVEPQLDQKLNFELPNDEILFLTFTENGFEFLYQGEKEQFSVSKKEGSLKTLGDVLGDGYTIADTNGDFIPDYRIQKGNVKKIEVKMVEPEINHSSENRGE